MKKTEDIFEKLENIQNLPTLPVVLDRLRKAICDPNVNAKQIEQILQDDPAITARILKVVNSAFYGAFDPINSLKLAVTRMGITAINNISLSTSVFSSFQENEESALDRENFWRHCISTGIAANVIYRHTQQNLSKRYSADLLHVTGLLHDIGKVIFEQFFHDEFTESIQSSASECIPLTQAENRIIGVDHTQIGMWLGEKWKLTNETLQVIRWHHDPDSAVDEHRELVMLSHTANYICNIAKIGNSGDLTAPTYEHKVWKQLGLEVGDISNIIDEVNEESAKSEILLAIAE